MDLLLLLKNYGLPVAGAVSGFVATSYAVRTRVKNLERIVTSLKKGWRLEIDQFKTDQAARAKDFREELEKKHNEYKQKLERLETEFNVFQRNSASSFATDEELSAFIQEQQNEWKRIQRTLGQIEGAMKKLP